MHIGLRRIIHEIAAQRSELFHWAPVFMAVGIAVSFSYGWPVGVVGVAMAVIVVMIYVAVFGLTDSPVLPVVVIIACIAVGAGAAALRSYLVWGPSLSYPYAGWATGRVVLVDRSAGDNMRLTLDQVTLGPIPQAKTPRRIRVSFAPDTVTQRPAVGDRVRAKVYVSPPQGPVEPGGFDFRRHAYFLSLGGVGYGRDGFEITDPATPNGLDLFLPRLQSRLSEMIRNAVSEQAQGVARAIIAGDRYGVTQEQAEDLRRSNLAHLLAISGLHMGLLTSLIFFMVRALLVLVPIPALALRAKSTAALCAIAVGALYLGISGGNVATQRAFVMVSAFYVAAMLNRRVISFRALAMAAMGILMARPEALFSPGFQMSFAATLALVYVFQTVVLSRVSGRVTGYVLGVFLSSFVAGLATAPIAAIHFNQVSHVGFVANLLAVPVMSAIVAPSAIVGLILAPFGFEAIGFIGVDWGLRWILYVAHRAASFSFAVSYTVTPLWWGLPVLSIGALLVVLWRGVLGRVLGAFVLMSSIAAWFGASRPDVLIARDATLVGVWTPQGRALSKLRGDRFTAEIWMENDGVRLERTTAHALWTDEVRGIRHFWSKKDAGKTIECSPDEIVVVAIEVQIIGPCVVITSGETKESGAMALWRDPTGAVIGRRHAVEGIPTFMWRDTRPPFGWAAGTFQGDRGGFM